jgi:S1-C subfamily serine protease
VSSVDPGGLAEAAGFKVGDVIISMVSPLATVADELAPEVLKPLEPGMVCTVTVRRDVIAPTVTVQPQPITFTTPADTTPDGASGTVEVRAVTARRPSRRSRPATACLRRSLTFRRCGSCATGAQNGAKVIVTDVANGCAATGLVRKDDMICAINGTAVTDEIHSTEVARSAVGEVVYSILRGNERIKVTAHKPQASTRLGVTVKNITAVPRTDGVNL